jgi:hypothetical protein
VREQAGQERVLDLKAGEWVEIRSQEEILASLDESGRLSNLPFMPEMFQYCGRRFRVAKRADKTCDNIENWSIRRVEHAVHLENARCDGSLHGGCEAGCLIFWKEAWLKRAEPVVIQGQGSRPASQFCSIEQVLDATRKLNSQQVEVYSCQATELRNYTSHMAWWDPRQYVRDLRSGNLKSGMQDKSLSGRVLEFVLNLVEVFRIFLISFFVDHRKFTYPAFRGELDRTPVETLDLQPGELVQVRSKEEILATLNEKNRNRGLLFDGEMIHYCGGIYRVLRRVYRIIDEKTGKMMDMKHPCIILEGVACRADFHRLCPRAIYHYWRESWLTRVTSTPQQYRAEQTAETCEKC